MLQCDTGPRTGDETLVTPFRDMALYPIVSKNVNATVAAGVI